MHKTLHIVSGTAVANVMKQAKLSGDFLAWKDFLHEGPVPKNFSLQQLSKIRTHFLYENNYISKDEVLYILEKRDDVLRNYNRYKNVILWFEQDLYDQLQLLQVLNYLAEYPDKNVKLSIVLTKGHFAEFSFQEILQAELTKKPITKGHFKEAQKAWLALCEDNPLSWFNLLNKKSSNLPFLRNSLQRLLEEYPNTINGLSRTEHQALLSISKAEKRKREDIFYESQKQEEHPFIADFIFWKILDNFKKYHLIAIRENNDIHITELGKDVLSGKQNWTTIKKVDHWVGGVHLSDDNLWCWDISSKSIAKYYYSKVLLTLMPIKQKNINLLNK